MKNLLAVSMPALAAAMFATVACADAQTVYKWTDDQGVVHYSDKPPQEATLDLQTLDLPAFPPQDPAKLAADQAALAASTAALVQQQQAEQALQQRDEELALERAQLQAAQQALQQDQQASAQPAPVYAIYANSPFIPRSYRRNLYVPHRFGAHNPEPKALPVMQRPPLSMVRKP